MFTNFEVQESKPKIPNVFIFMNLLNKSISRTYPGRPGQLYLYFKDGFDEIVQQLEQQGYVENIDFRRATLPNHLEIMNELKKGVIKERRYEDFLTDSATSILNIPGIYTTFMSPDGKEILCFQNQKVYLKIVEKLQTEERLETTDFTIADSIPQALVVDKSIKRTPQGLVIQYPDISPSYSLLSHLLNNGILTTYLRKPGQSYLVFRENFEYVIKKLKEERFRENFDFRIAAAKNHLEIMGNLKNIVVGIEKYWSLPVNSLLKMPEIYNIHEGPKGVEYLTFKDKIIFKKFVEKLTMEELLIEGIDYKLSKFLPQSIFVSGRIKKTIGGFFVDIPELEIVPKKPNEMLEEKIEFPWLGIQPLPMSKEDKALLDLPVTDLLNKACYTVDPQYPNIQYLCFPFTQARFMDNLIDKLLIETDLVEGIDFYRTNDYYCALQMTGRMKKTEAGIIISPKSVVPMLPKWGPSESEFLTLPAREILSTGVPDLKNPDKEYLRFNFSSGRLLKQLVEKLKSEEGLVEGVDFNIVKNQYCTLEILGRIKKTELGIIIKAKPSESVVKPFWVKTEIDNDPVRESIHLLQKK